ncbi:MAG: hypothetical protein WCF57_04030 [Pyrinomonadaceae bacterium]
MSENLDFSKPLNARQIAKSLIPQHEILEEFLLWPPDLFAFTSHILSITGAYHLVVSPPRCEEVNSKVVWPPEDDWAKPSWNDYVRRVGLDWRDRLRKNFTEEELWSCKQQTKRAQEKALYARAGQLVKDNKSFKWQEGSWVPLEVGEHWRHVYSWMSPGMEGNVEDILCNEAKQLSPDLLNNWEAFKSLITLHAIIDEACIGWGIRDLHFKKVKKGVWQLREEDHLPDSPPAIFAKARLMAEGTMATINNQRCRVLPKRHTPRVGITLRSLTSNLAYHRSSVDVKWKINNDATNNLIRRMESEHKTFSLLLLPWPMEIRALDFMPAEKVTERLTMDREKYGLFSYAPQKRWFTERMLMDTLDSALKETNSVDMIILPECALAKDEIDDFENVIGDTKYRVSSYVTGVRDAPAGGEQRRFNDNMVYFKMGMLGEGKHAVTYPVLDPKQDPREEIQYKHHRWKLERYQITNYSLGHVLTPHKEWWESIKIRRRKVTFINIGRELTICPLICEDLARQDPIADLIRTVGPSLVITILMDGPQKKDRWSARYASVLSEDPGSAVIALTSFGMVNRWRHPYHPPSRVVALWNDGKGLEREIELEEDSVGILLSLSVDGTREPTADGRVENYPTNTVTLGGIHQIRYQDNR